MLHEEALDVLGLKPGATAAEIKEAYRDLVKVWHPDRFGSDVRLRRKAEEKLQQVNDAYRVLQSAPTPDFTRTDAVRRPHAEPSAVAKTYGARSNRVIAGWILGGLGIVAVIVVGVLALTHGWSRTQAPVVPEAQPQASTGAVDHAGSSQKAPRIPQKDATRSGHAATEIRVRKLSEGGGSAIGIGLPESDGDAGPEWLSGLCPGPIGAFSA